MRVTNGDAYAIPSCILPKNVADRSIDIELGIKIFLRFKSGADIVRKLVHALSRFQRRYSRPNILANRFSRILGGLIFEDDDRGDGLAVFRQLQLKAIESLMGFDNMRGPGHRAVALLVCRNPRNCLKNPTVPMPRIFAVGYSE
jgi:hypothetical protein